MPEFLDLFAKIILELTHEVIIIPLIIIGYIWIDKKTFFHGICLMLISILFNAALKATFRVPLSPMLGKDGFAFPSGHMQSATVLYGWLYKWSKNMSVRITLVILLFLIALSLMHFGYHGIQDISAAVFFGLALIFGYAFSRKRLKESHFFLALIAFGAGCILYNKLVYRVDPHLWRIYYALLGLLGSEYFFGKKQTLLKRQEGKWLATIVCFFSVAVIHYLFLMLHDMPSAFQPLRWSVIGFFVPFSVFISHFIYHRKRTNAN